MVDGREQRVRVGRQVHAHDLGALVDDEVDEARVLVREAVVVLAPYVRRQQVVQRRDRAAPRQRARDLQPFRVLVEHRVDDVRERLVAREQTVPAGEEVALEPAFARRLREDLHHAAVGSEVLVDRERRSPATPSRSPRRPRRAGSTRSRPVRTAGSCAVSALSAEHVPEKRAEDARRLRVEARPAPRPLSRSRGCRAGADRGGARRRWCAGSRPSAGCREATSRRSRPSARLHRRTILRDGRSASIRRVARGARGCPALPRAAPGARAPRAFDRHTVDLLGPVHPFGVRSTIIGQRGRA